MTISIESLLAARLFLSPQLLGNRLFFLSNLGQGGHLSLYAMDAGGSIPEPQLPAHIAMPNPELAEGEVFVVFLKLGKILLMLDRDVVEQLQAAGKQVDYLVFEDEGHDVLKYANRVTCYTTIAEFFKMYL